jgi:O-antigen/teichoic acid export membrane protein
MKIAKIFKNQAVRESGILFLAQSLNIVISGLTFTILRPNFLSPRDIGLISYINSLVVTLAHFFNFGLDNTGCRLIINHDHHQEKRRIAGMTIFISLMLCALFSLILYGISFLIPYFGNSEAVPLVRLVIPFSAYVILQFFLINLCYALGEIRIATFMIIAGNAIYLPIMLILNKMNLYTVKIAIFCEYALQMLILLIPLLLLGGRQIKAHKDLWQSIKIENKTVGLKVFWARIIFLPSFDMDKLILGAFYSLENVGFYTLAKMFSSPAIVLGQSIAKSLYRRYNNKNLLAKPVLIFSLASIILLALFVLICGYIVIIKFMNCSYLPVLTVLPLAIIAAIINGYIAVFASFMDAKGMANEVRNIAVVGMVLSVSLNFGLIIPFGMTGGMISRIIVLLVMLLMRGYYCNRFSQREQRLSENLN